MLTIQRILAKELPNILGVSPEEIGADGSPFSRSLCVDRMEAANRDLAHMGAIRETRYLQSTYDFEVPQGAAYEYEVPYPANVDTPIKLVSIQDDGRETGILWSRDLKQPPETYPGFTASSYGGSGGSQYAFRGDQLIMFSPRPARYRLYFQRSPGSMCYGVVESVNGDDVILAQPIEGRLSNQDRDYIGDAIVFTKGGEADEIGWVTEYNAAARTVTLRASASVDDTWEYSFVSWLPRSYQYMHVYYTAMSFTVERPEGAAAAAQKYALGWPAMETFLKPDDATTPNRVTQVDPGMAFGRSYTQGGYGGGYFGR